jgi:hypothetical protein
MRSYLVYQTLNIIFCVLTYLHSTACMEPGSKFDEWKPKFEWNQFQSPGLMGLHPFRVCSVSLTIWTSVVLYSFFICLYYRSRVLGQKKVKLVVWTLQNMNIFMY